MVVLSVIIIINQIFYFYTAKIIYDSFIWQQLKIGVDEGIQSKILIG